MCNNDCIPSIEQDIAQSCLSNPPGVHVGTWSLRDPRVRAKLCSADMKVGLWPKVCVQLFKVFPVAKRAMVTKYGDHYVQKMANTLCEPAFVTAFLDELGDTTWEQLCDALVVVGCGSCFLSLAEAELRLNPVIWPPPSEYKLPKLTIDG